MASVDNNTIGPRAQFFIDQCAETKTQIVQKVLIALVESQSLKTNDFAQKYITQKGQQELSDLDQRTKTLFKNVIYDVMVHFAQHNMLSKFIMLSMLSGNDRFSGNFIKEAALPLVKNLVATLDLNDKAIIDEATSSGVPSDVEAVLTKLNME